MNAIKRYIKKHKRASIIVGVVLLLIIISTLFKGDDQMIETYTADRRDVVEQVEISGTIDSVSRADIGFKTTGRVARISVSEGATVYDGQVIATLDSSELYADLLDAQSDLDAVLADSDVTTVDLAAAKKKLEDTIAQQDTLVDNAYRALLNNDLQAYVVDSSDDQTPPTISGTYNSTETGEYELDMYSSGGSGEYAYRLSGLESGIHSADASASAMGKRGLFASFTDGETYNRVEFVVPIPNIRSTTYQTYKNSYDAAVRARDIAISSAQEEYDRLVAQEQGTGGRAAKTAAQISSARARVQAAQARIEDTVIRAPFAGVVARLDLEIGETVTSSDQPVTIVTDKAYEMIVQVPEIDVAKIATDDPVVVTLDAFVDASWEGVIRHIDIIDTQVEGVSVYETTVEILNPDERIRVGMNARASIETDRKDDVLAIPQYFISKTAEGLFVTVKNDEESTVRRVETGTRSSDGFVEITDGLSEGEVVTRVIQGA